MPPLVTHLLPVLQSLTQTGWHALRDLFLAPGSSISLQSLACAFCIAALFLVLKRKGRRVRLAVLIRALLPKRMATSASGKADIGFFVFNVCLASVLFGWAILSNHQISLLTHAAMAGVFGEGHGPLLAPWISSAILTVGLFLAYELGYWVDHYLSHKIPFLWAFHRVHHTAQQLSPLTNFRVHPVDSVVYLNILALFTGATNGVLTYVLGEQVKPFALAGSNVILLALLFLLIHLQHSHIWIATRGVWGRIILSPAHHQLHHSTNPAHFDRNFGGCLSIWDWLFGTLLIPAARRERLTFGVAPDGEDVHSVTGGLITPVLRAMGTLGGAANEIADPQSV